MELTDLLLILLDFRSVRERMKDDSRFLGRELGWTLMLFMELEKTEC